MSETINIYCDESCHLHNPSNPVMVQGCVWCTVRAAHTVSKRLHQLKLDHGLGADYELKWVHVSPAKLDYYRAVIGLFFADPELRFRAVVIPDKELLDHQKFDQTPEDFFYKVYYLLLQPMLSPEGRYQTPDNASYRVYIDYKDTQCSHRAANLGTVLRTAIHDDPPRILDRIQAVRSHEIELLQLADLLIGTVAYANRGLQSSDAKSSLVAEVASRAQQSLTASTPLTRNKVNIFRFTPSGAST